MDALERLRGRALLRHVTDSTLLRSEAGSTTLEFAMAIPILILLIAGSMVAMLGLLCFGNVTHATGIAARYAAIHSNASDVPATNDSITAAALAHVWIASRQSQVNATWSAGNVPGSTVTVTTALSLPLGIPFTGVHQLTVTTSAARVITR